ncbi:MAG TPA: hypothetical protein VM618_05580 [Acidimicrobiia bacterium]|nr:hypothetical protein [Acidimicrobiia bacterium]
MAVADAIPVLDPAVAETLSLRFHRCWESFEADDGLFADDAFFDLMPPFWRFQLEGGQAFVDQLRAVAEQHGALSVSVEMLRTVPTATGFVTEHRETIDTEGGAFTARRVHVCEVRDGRIAAVTTYCNGGWDDELRARHAAEAPMLRP